MESLNAQCTGSPTFNLANPGDNKFSEWPDNISGLICKTAPFGYYSSSRFSQCCSGKVYNITEPTTPDDPAYPMSCALFCQIDPELDESNDRYPYGFSEHFMCLNNGHIGGDQTDEEFAEGAGEVVCATVTAVNGDPIPTSYESSWTGDWQTRSYYSLDIAAASWSWVEDGETYTPPSSTTTGGSSMSSSSHVSSAMAETTTESPSTKQETTGSTLISASRSGDEQPAETIAGGDDSTDAAGSILSWTVKSVLGAALAVSVLIM